MDDLLAAFARVKDQAERDLAAKNAEVDKAKQLLASYQQDLHAAKAQLATVQADVHTKVKEERAAQIRKIEADEAMAAEKLKNAEREIALARVAHEESVRKEKELMLKDVVKERDELEKMKAQFEKEREAIFKEQLKGKRRLKLNVGGTLLETSTDTLSGPRAEGSMLQALVSGRHELQLDEEGRLFLDYDGPTFSLILNWLRTGVVPMNLEEDQHARLIEGARFYQLSQLLDALPGGGDKPAVSHAKFLQVYATSLSTWDSQSDRRFLLPLNFIDQDLRAVCFSGLHLRSSIFQNCDMSGCNLLNANLKQANFSGSNLSGCDLRNANVEGTIFCNTNFTDADLRNVRLQKERPFGFTGHYPLSSNSNLGNRLDGAVFDGVKVLKSDSCQSEYPDCVRRAPRVQVMDM